MDKMKDLAYYNGKITAIDDMMIPANDRYDAVHYQ